MKKILKVLQNNNDKRKNIVLYIDNLFFSFYGVTPKSCKELKKIFTILQDLNNLKALETLQQIDNVKMLLKKIDIKQGVVVYQNRKNRIMQQNLKPFLKELKVLLNQYEKELVVDLYKKFYS